MLKHTIEPSLSSITSMCELSIHGCDQQSKYKYQTCSKICGDLKTIIHHQGALPIIDLTPGVCGLINFGCNDIPRKHPRTNKYYQGCSQRHTRMIESLIMNGMVVTSGTTCNTMKKKSIAKYSYSQTQEFERKIFSPLPTWMPDFTSLYQVQVGKPPVRKSPLVI